MDHSFQASGALRSWEVLFFDQVPDPKGRRNVGPFFSSKIGLIDGFYGLFSPGRVLFDWVLARWWP